MMVKMIKKVASGGGALARALSGVLGENYLLENTIMG